MEEITTGRFAGNASMIVGGSFVAFIILAVLGAEPLLPAVVAVASLLAFAVVLGIAQSLVPDSPGWILWGSSLGLFGLALTAIAQSRLLLGVDRPEVRPEMTLAISTVTAWILITSIVALTDSGWPRAWSWVGIVLSLMWAGLIPAQQLGIRVAAMGLSAGATILASVWFIWAGALMRAVGGDRERRVHRGRE